LAGFTASERNGRGENKEWRYDSMAVDKRGRKLPKGIRQKGDRLEGRFTYQGQSYSVYGDTVTETQKRIDDLKYRLQHNLFVEREKVTLDNWFTTWMTEYKENQVKIGTYRHYLSIYNANIKGVLGKRYLTDIRAEHIQRLYNDLAKEGRSNDSIKLVRAVLSGCLKQAFKNGLIERNPIGLTDLPKGKEQKPRKALTKEEQALFLEYAESSYLYNFFSLLLRTGARCGEMRGLKYSDIDKKAGVIHIQRTLVRVKGKGEIEDTPKTKTSKRDIPLTAATLQIIEAQRKQWGSKVTKMNGYVFTDDTGKAFGHIRVQGELNRIIKRIQADGYDFDRITPHVFRHTFATRAIEAGMQPQVLKTILGHSSLSMTMDLYSHVMDDTKAEEMKKIDIAF
jgi:integrase